MQFLSEDEFKNLIYYHLFENESGRELLQKFREDDFAKEHIAPEGGGSRSSFSEPPDSRGKEQLQHVFRKRCLLSRGVIPAQHSVPGDFILIGGSLISAVLSMYWADYRKNSRKAKGHFGLDLSHGIPSAVYLTAGSPNVLLSAVFFLRDRPVLWTEGISAINFLALSGRRKRGQIRIAIQNELRNPLPDTLPIFILMLSKIVKKMYAKI